MLVDPELHHQMMTVESLPVPTDLNEWSTLVRVLNDRWWRDPETQESLGDRNTGELLMLMVSEIAEAMEAHRKNMMDDKLPHRSGVEVELADLLIRLFDFAGHHGLDLQGTVLEKLEYNRHRKDHTHEARLGAHGKKY